MWPYRWDKPYFKFICRNLTKPLCITMYYSINFLFIYFYCQQLVVSGKRYIFRYLFPHHLSYLKKIYVGHFLSSSLFYFNLRTSTLLWKSYCSKLKRKEAQVFIALENLLNSHYSNARRERCSAFTVTYHFLFYWVYKFLRNRKSPW